MDKTQKSELLSVFENMKDCSNLDYVTCWYKKAARYIQETNIEVAFVSTNSICQGEQVAVLWPELMNKHGVKINFAHQTFKWWNEARGKAMVYCVIIGFSLKNNENKKIFIYPSITGSAIEIKTKQINNYLLDAPVVFIEKRVKPLCKVSEMIFGNMPNDGGNLLLSEGEKKAILKKEPEIKNLIRPFLGADEFINNIPRYCIWLKDVSPAKYEKSKEIRNRIVAVKEYRKTSKRAVTQKLAEFPALFGEIRQPESDYLLVPGNSSEKRKYIPIGFIDKNTISSNATIIIPNATRYEFGILSSVIHMAWTRCVCGRLGNGLRYSATLVYNNFPWPNPTEKQKEKIEEAAQGVLDARIIYSGVSLAQLYAPDMMIPELAKAHQKLDRAVDAAYGRSFADDSERVAYLFELYQKLSGELFRKEKKRGKGRKI
jgi:hypothetical protein